MYGKRINRNSLSYVMRAVLKGEVSDDDIDKIYAQTCFTEDSMPNIIRGYDYCWQESARARAEAEICKKYEVKDIWDLEDGEKSRKARQELQERARELIPQVVTEAETLLHKLWDEGKIIQTRYRVPEGQTVKAKVFPGHEIHYFGGQVSDEVEVTGKGQGRDEEILNLNGEYYYFYDTSVASFGISYSGFFNDEIGLIANQLCKGYSWQDSQRNADRVFVFQKMFPQYKEAIAQVGGKLNTDLREEDILGMLQEALRERGEHTVKEIREGFAGLTPDEVGKVLYEVTGMGDLGHDPHTIE